MAVREPSVETDRLNLADPDNWVPAVPHPGFDGLVLAEPVEPRVRNGGHPVVGIGQVQAVRLDARLAHGHGAEVEHVLISRANTLYSRRDRLRAPPPDRARRP